VEVEALEDRLVMSTLTVMSADDPAVRTPGTLRDVVHQADQDAFLGQADTIKFAPGVNNITLKQGQLELVKGAQITIDGGSGVTINAKGASRVFEVDGDQISGANVVLKGLTIMGGKAVNPGDGGGAIDVEQNATVRVDHDNLTENQAFDGGAIFNQQGTVIVDHSHLTLNSSTNAGGAIYNNDGVLMVNDSTIAVNSAVDGGGIQNDHGSLAVTGSTFAFDGASQNGGAINSQLASRTTVSNSTFNHNVATIGGAIENGAQSNLTVSNSTLADNAASSNGGGIDNENDAPVKLLNNIVSNSATRRGPDIFGAVTGSNNLIRDGQGVGGITDGVNGNMVGTAENPKDPQLAPLANNGGPTFTMNLLPGSPALNAGGALTTAITGMAASKDANTVTVADASFANTQGESYIIRIGTEQMRISFVDGSNTLTVERGINGTPIEAHSAGDPLFFAFDQRGQQRTLNNNVSDLGAVQTPFMDHAQADAGGPSAMAAPQAVGVAPVAGTTGGATPAVVQAATPGKGAVQEALRTVDSTNSSVAPQSQFQAWNQAVGQVFASDFGL
jgi:hypothetical protein